MADPAASHLTSEMPAGIVTDPLSVSRWDTSAHDNQNVGRLEAQAHGPDRTAASGKFGVDGDSEGFFEGGESFADFGHGVVA